MHIDTRVYSHLHKAYKLGRFANAYTENARGSCEICSYREIEGRRTFIGEQIVSDILLKRFCVAGSLSYNYNTFNC